jgi:arylsulfatase A-like enzyme
MRRLDYLCAALLALFACGGEAPAPSASGEPGLAAGAAPSSANPPAPSAPAPHSQALAPDGSEWPVNFAVEGPPSFERVVLVTIDTLRRDHVSAYGYFRATTPFFDRCAAAGVLFDDAISPVSHTAPSHASMLTGLPPDVHGLMKNGEKLAANARDLARVFRAAQFETAAFVAVKFLRGGLCESFDSKAVATNEGATVVDAALGWLQQFRTRERFFLWVHLYDPHLWRERKSWPRAELSVVKSWNEPQEELLARWTRMHGLEAAAAQGYHFKWNDGEDENRASEVGGTDEYVDLMNAYDALILHADRQVERLVGALEAAQLLDGTLIVITSDHGEGLGSHDVAGHGGRIYQEQLRVPLVVFAGSGAHAPQHDRALPARRVSETVQLLDLYPTLAEACGARVTGLDPLLHGASLWPLLRGEPGWRARPVFSQRRPSSAAPALLFSVQDGGAKLLREVGVKDEFYRLDVDPLERENRAGEPSAERDRLERLLQARIDLRQRHADPALDAPLPADVLEELKRFGYVGDG